jgi:integrase
MRKTLTDKGVASLKPRAERYAFPDPECRGVFVRVQPSGAKSFAAVTRQPNGRQVWATIGPTDLMSINEARERARAIIKRIRDGLPAVEAKADTFSAVSQNWIKRHVEPNGLRTAPEIKRILDKHILPTWRDREFTAIRRSDVAALLDKVQDNHGPRQADTVLDVLRAIMFWFATRHDSYNPPVVRGMKRQSTKARARARILTDDEIRAVWKLAEANGTFGAIIRIALLTAQRRAKIVSMKWSDIDDNGVWRIPTEAREKGNIGAVALPRMALDVINQQPRLASNEFVFAGRGGGYYNNLAPPKRKFVKQLPDMPAWTIHDCRRTARSLLSRCGVSSEHAERVMGHTIPGIEGTYDRHRYDAEKKSALEKLAQLIDGILHERANVLPLTKRKKS